jgi:adenine-specific DNA-methyltransferase
MMSRMTPAELLAAVDASRHRHREAVDVAHQAAMGQYLTPPESALRMAAMFRLPQRRIRVLDPGAGAGALTAALVATLVAREEPPTELHLVAVELDPIMLPNLCETLAACEEVARSRDVKCTWEVIEGDYVAIASHCLEGGLFGERAGPSYEAVITNPPYKKIQTGSAPRRALERVGLVTSNLYAGFVALAVAQLVPDGEYVAITPRSWCNGSYFEPFRRWLFGRTSLEAVHIYGRRDLAFSDDAVLTENIIYHGLRATQRPTVRISESAGPAAPTTASQEVPFDRVVRPDDPHAYVHLVTADTGHAVADAIRALPATLATLGIEVSTGRVVDFRASEWLRREPVEGGYPLVYPTHCAWPHVEWPKLGGKKANGLSPETPDDILIPSGHYTLVKRFSSKEERRRIVATVFDPSYVPGRLVGLENHLNYFHAKGRPLEPELAYGLAAFLNTEAVDVAFRQFSGHTQVNATDLRGLRYPDATTLRRAGAAALRRDEEECQRVLDEALGTLSTAG